MDRLVEEAAIAFAVALTGRVAARGGNGRFEATHGPNYLRIVLCDAQVSTRLTTFCFVARDDAPFGWRNYRAGDVLPPMTARKPWKMDTGAVANVLADDGGLSYWVTRYGSQLGLW